MSLDVIKVQTGLHINILKKEINEILKPPTSDKLLFRRLQLVDDLKDNG